MLTLRAMLASACARRGDNEFYSVDGGNTWKYYEKSVVLEESPESIQCFSIYRGVKSEVKNVSMNGWAGSILGNGNFWFLLIGSAFIVGFCVVGIEMSRKKKKEEATNINKQNGSSDSKRQKSLKRIYIAPFLKEKFCTNKKKKSINNTTRQKFINNNNNCFVSQYISTETDTNTPLSLIKSRLQIKRSKIISNTSENTINDKHDGFISSFSPSISESKTNSFYGIRINLYKKRTRNNKSPDSLNVTDCKVNDNNSAEKTKCSQNTRNLSNYFGVGTIDNKSILNALNNFSLSFMKKKSRGFLSKSPKNSNINSFNVTYNSGNYKLPFVHSFSCSHTLRKNSKVFLITNDK